MKQDHKLTIFQLHRQLDDRQKNTMQPYQELTILQLQQALDNMHKTMLDKDGNLLFDRCFFKVFDDLMEGFSEVRAVAENLRRSS